MRKPHVHAEIIKAWADGYAIEFFNEVYSGWDRCPTRVMPTWDPDIEYRIKPEQDDEKDLQV